MSSISVVPPLALQIPLSYVLVTFRALHTVVPAMILGPQKLSFRWLRRDGTRVEELVGALVGRFAIRRCGMRCCVPSSPRVRPPVTLVRTISGVLPLLCRWPGPDMTTGEEVRIKLESVKAGSSTRARSTRSCMGAASHEN